MEIVTEQDLSTGRGGGQSATEEVKREQMEYKTKVQGAFRLSEKRAEGTRIKHHQCLICPEDSGQGIIYPVSHRTSRYKLATPAMHFSWL